MIELKNNFSGGLDTDTSYDSPEMRNRYVDALNITRDAVAANQDTLISNIVGNRIIEYSYTAAGTNTCIGAVANSLRNTAIALIYNTAGYHSIIEWNLTTRVTTKVFENLTDSDDIDVLGFTLSGKITGINIFNRDEGDLLFFIDSIDRPTFLNITLFKAGAYTPVTRQILNVAKIPPPSPPDAVYDNDTTRVSNFLQKKLFRFKYRWIYDDDLKSTYSPISAVPLPANILNDVAANVITNNNVISLSIGTGAKNVKAIEIAVSIQNNQNLFSRFQTVEVLNKQDDSIDDDTTTNFMFYNDSTYAFIADDDSLPLFDWVPRYAKSQEMPNGNALCYGAITEGYDRDLSPNVVTTVLTVAAGGGGAVGSLNAVSAFLLHVTGADYWQTSFSGVPAVGTNVTITIKRKSDNVIVNVGTVTTVSGDTAGSVAEKMRLSMIATGVVGISSFPLPSPVIVSGDRLRWLWSTDDYDFPLTTTVTPPSTPFNTNSISTWPFYGQRRMGIAYYDENGVTNGILYDTDVTFPPYAENGSQQILLPYINVKIYHQPPDWAYSYQLCFTKDNTQFLYIETVDVNVTEPEYIYFDISNLPLNARKRPTTEAVVSWSFQDGDRVRLVRRMSDATVFGSAYDSAIEGIVASPTINNVAQTDKTFLKIKKVAPFSTVNYGSDFFILQLYRPSLQEPSNENATFYECGVQYPILNPTEATRVHAGQVSDQSEDFVTPAEINVYEGDVYYRVRNQVLGEMGVGTFYIQDRNFVDNWISAVNNIDGRPQVIDINAKETYFPALVRFSRLYQANTNINGLNKFLAQNFDEYDYGYGDIFRLKVRDRFMRVYQRLKVGVVYIFSKIGKAQNGDEITVVTDQLLNPIQYYSGDYGIGDNKCSLASFNFADYFTSNVTGGIYRVSKDGITPISVLYKVNSWATTHIPLRTSAYNIYGAYDQRLNNYIMAMEATDTDAAVTLTFSEEDNTFESFLSMQPEMMVTVGTLLCAFKNGQLWTHDSDQYNTFFGTSYESTITPVFADNSHMKKQPISITESASQVWDCPEIITQVKTYGSTPQQSNLVTQEFADLEGQYSAAIKRDINSPGGKINGQFLKGNWTKVKFRVQNAIELTTLDIVILKVNESPLNLR